VHCSANEKLAWFLEDIVLHEPEAFSAFHYLFARYRNWRTGYGLLRTQLSQADFARAIQAQGIRTDFDRELFLGIYTRREEVRFSFEELLRIYRPEYARCRPVIHEKPGIGASGKRKPRGQAQKIAHQLIEMR
jgi:hypothetical protein